MSDPSFTCFSVPKRIFYSFPSERLLVEASGVLDNLSTLSKSLAEYETQDGLLKMSIDNTLKNVDLARKHLGLLKSKLEEAVKEETMSKQREDNAKKIQKFKWFANKHGIPYNSMTEDEMAAAWDAIEKENIRNKFYTSEPEQKQGISLFGGPSGKKIFEPDTAYIPGVTPPFQTTSTLFGHR